MSRSLQLSRLFLLGCITVLGSRCLAAGERTDTLSLRSVVNRGFRDETPGDLKGGWTDQGPDNDLATFRPGRLVASHVPFEIIDPAQNGGRSALVLGQASQKVAHDAGEAARSDSDAPADERGTVTVAALSLSEAGPYRFLYLLHASANPPPPPQAVGYLVIRYADGSETTHELRNRRDLGNWRDPSPAENAGLAWESENPTASIGLYVSRFAVEERPLASVTFRQAGSAPWMIIALSASTQEHTVGVVPRSVTIEPGPDWAPYAHSLDVAPGSVFDFSSLLHMPAGRYGALRSTPEGHFEFAGRPGERARFWGVNLCFSAQYLERSEADLLAERLSRSGYNTVRFHHFDAELVRGGRNSWELNAEALDRLDYLVAALKKRGLYLNIDLYSSRPFGADEVKGWGVPLALRAQFKSLLPLNDAVFDSWARYATNLLSHRNPYTGLTWAEDPAFIGICPVNENPLFNRVESPGDVFALYAQAFAASGLAGTAAPANPAFNRFIHELNRRSDERMAAHLRSLGVMALLTGANYTISQGLAYVREHYDYVDCHSYWDHPKFPVKAWALPIAFGQGSAVKAAAKMPNRIMPTRVFGLPFVCTEFNFCRPNRNRFEGAVLMPAYASLQDWDAMYNFQYAMSRSMAIHGGVDNYFALANDPIGLIADRVGALLFQRGDITPARRSIAYAVQPEEAFSALGRLFPGEFSPLGLVTRIGSVTGRPDVVLAGAGAALNLVAVVSGGTPESRFAKTYRPDDTLFAALQWDGILPANSISADRSRYASDTGQIELRTDEGIVKVVTPRSELFALAPDCRLAGNLVTVANGPTRGAIAVIALASVADQPLSLATARRILITHLTDALPQGMRFAHTDRKLLESWGKGPHLMQRGEATLTLALPAGSWRAWAVDATGARTREVPLHQQDGHYVLTLATVSPAGTQLAYELAR